MIGEHAFCQTSGAPLSEETSYDEDGTARRHVVQGDEDPDTAGELTNGGLRSSRRALVAYFRRAHRKHHDYDEELYRRAALALRRLKRAASGAQAADRHVWFALKCRLDRTGHDVAWMDDHVALRCPNCHGRLRFGADPDGTVRAACGTDCDGTSEDRLERTREAIASLYGAAFEDSPPAVDDLLQF